MIRLVCDILCMDRYTSGGTITITFDNSDWIGGRALGMIDGIKEKIPAHQREYNAETKTWYIEASDENHRIIQNLYQTYFSDPNQLNLDL